ncbi:hypothetical protein BJ170DRAFT_314743 [Xylariales sp. AK1849]|nr:hypothetical protein BJ170DRAFT_314743 [Xylariales sp. AK1849]
MMIAPTQIPLRATASIVVTAQPDVVQRQVTIIQTIAYPDSTFTAVVTLGNGGPATDAPSPPSGGDTSSGGLSQEQTIGIIVGSCLGVAVLILVAWCCLSMARRRQVDDGTISTASYDSYDSSYMTSVAQPRRTGWPSWRSIPPPVVPTYRARPVGPQWTANHRASTTYIRR